MNLSMVDVLTVAQAAEYLQVHPDAIYREIKAGHLVAIRINKRGDFRISRDALNEWWQRRSA